MLVAPKILSNYLKNKTSGGFKNFSSKNKPQRNFQDSFTLFTEKTSEETLKYFKKKTQEASIIFVTLIRKNLKAP